MSTALAIASVTLVLKDLLNNGLIDHDLTSTVGNVAVTALPPDRIDTSSANQQSQLNLFMYQVTPNAGWRNVGFPSRDSGGARVENPPLALDLHYMLTAYGAEEFHGEILLGYGMQLLHETPILTREAMRIALAPPSPIGGGNLPVQLQSLSTSGLADQIEQIKIIPQMMSTEEASRMWSALQSHYRPTAMYQASAVLIQSQRSTKRALPVRERRASTTPFRQPTIGRLLSQASDADPVLANQPILAGYNLIIQGQGLQGEATQVDVGGIRSTPAPDAISETQVQLPIPNAVPAGVHGVQVIRNGFASNVAAFVLRPQLLTIAVSDVQGSGSELRTATIDVTVEPVVNVGQRASLLLNELNLPGDRAAHCYSFNIPPLAPPDALAALSFPIRGVEAGDYLVRIQVDGAESPLQTNDSGQYATPQVTIP